MKVNDIGVKATNFVVH